MDRIKTGIDGLDKVIEGGFPKGFTVLVSGQVGAGKTIFGLQFLYEGARRNEPGLYVTFEETREDIIGQAKLFGWNLRPLEKKGKFGILQIGSSDIETAMKQIKEKIDKLGAKRLVIDSLTKLFIYTTIYSEASKQIIGKKARTGIVPELGSPIGKREMYHIIGEIKKLKTTTILISELLKDSRSLSLDEVSEFECDGVIAIYPVVAEHRMGRVLVIEKMRKTNILEDRLNMKIGDDGISLNVMIL